ncbi:hypothetical protein AYR56_05315 [Loigolactobacillus backii]|uniref:Uncharacterized protein n=2 Tax=Loigolactobacillus backii TaxID=375175 RepID=A0A192H4R8_9LACO|nr:hypothetical protein [Loigolactobacillus backii]ANK63375.1 hypothetical protein AYR53_11690 [Loigolactobacillus backii]ANK69620.1 hypothetical protein AYR56_05315 [Loigolactobacillus backii]MDA5386512.1 hypothetical protein [Loigolactobacillus backii]
MTEIKDNSIIVPAVLADVHPTNKGITKLSFEIDTPILGPNIVALAAQINSMVGLTITPKQTELDTDKKEDANPNQTELIKDGKQ